MKKQNLAGCVFVCGVLAWAGLLWAATQPISSYTGKLTAGSGMAFTVNTDGTVTAPSFTTTGTAHWLDVANTSDPDTTGWGSAEAGRIWYNATLAAFRYWTGASVSYLATGTAGDTTRPTVSTVAVGTDGTTTTVTFSETVVTTSYTSGDFYLTCSTAGGVNLASPTGTGPSRTLTAAATIYQGDACTLTYAGASGHVTDGSSNNLLGFSGYAVTNGSTQTGGGGGDVTRPTVLAATIGTNGTTLTLAMSETVTRSGGTFDVDCATAGSNITATYSSGSGTGTLVYTLGSTVNAGDTCDLDYDGAQDGIQDGVGNDLAFITSKPVTNNSTQSTTLTFDLSGYSTGWYAETGTLSKNASPLYLYPSALYTYAMSAYTTSLGSADHWTVAKVKLHAYGDRVGPMVRASGSAITHYKAWIRTDGIYLGQCVANNCATLTSNTGSSYTADTDYYVGLQVSGTNPVSLTVKVGTTYPPSTTAITYSDSAHYVQSGTYGGAFGYSEATQSDYVRISEVRGGTGSLP